MSAFKGGYTGKFLRVDLTRGRLTVEDTPDVTRWLSPRGWNALIGWNEVGPGVGPYDPETRLVFSVGPLVGTGAPTAGRMTVSSLSPRGYPQPMWISASMGGYIGAELKYAGYDGLVVYGRADDPRYLLIEDGRFALEDARDLWGRGIYDTQQALKERHGREVQVSVRCFTVMQRTPGQVGAGTRMRMAKCNNNCFAGGGHPGYEVRVD